MFASKQLIDVFSKNNPNVHFFSTFHGYLDDRSLIDIPMFLIEKAKEEELLNGIKYSYYFLLSGQDYPIVSTETMLNHLDSVYPKAFIDCTPYSKDNWIYSLFNETYRTRYLKRKIRVNESKILTVCNKTILLVRSKLSKLFHLKKKSLYHTITKQGINIFGGSAWWILPDLIVDYCYSEYKSLSKYVKCLLYCNTPEESFFQTVAMNSEYSSLIDVNSPDMVLQNCKTYAFFFDDSHPFCWHPYLINTAKVKEVLSWDKHWFARKFDINNPDSLMAMNYLDELSGQTCCSSFQNSIVIIVCYFGKLKPSFALWFESAKRNINIDFLLFIDDDISFPKASNVKVIKTTLASISDLASKKIGLQFQIDRPYKLCDFKPMYGLIFEDYIKDYEYWGYGDLDVLYGDIFGTLLNINYKRYSKINYAGHLCFLKNDSYHINLFKKSVDDTLDYINILTGPNVGFDEKSFNQKVVSEKIPMYDGTICADIVYSNKKANIVCGNMIKDIFYINQTHQPKKTNYKHQLFFMEDGRIIRYYIECLKLKKDEFCYIHYRLELPIYFEDYGNKTFLISFYPRGFYKVHPRKMTLMNYLLLRARLLFISVAKRIERYILKRL